MDNGRKIDDINKAENEIHNKNINTSSHRIDKDASQSDMRRGGVSAGTRRVNTPQQDIKRNTYARHDNEITEAEQHRNIERRRKQERLKRQRNQALAGLITAVVVTIVLVFMTPIFNIKEIRLNGNNIVSKEIINEKIGYLIGANLFGTSSSKIEKIMDEIPQIDYAEVDKHIFPSYVEINITECKPAAYMLSGNSTIVIDSDLTVIDDSNVFDREKLPSVSGLSVTRYELNHKLNVESNEKKDVLQVLLKVFEDTNLTESISYISIDDLTAIKFNYDNRIEVMCGSQLQLERKIRMFAETIKTDVINGNSVSTMDLSVPGKAEYVP